MTDRRSFCAGLASIAAWPAVAMGAAASERGRRVPILVYHRFARQAIDAMTVRAELFEAHLGVLRQMDCNVLSLADWIGYCRGTVPRLPPRALVITADDGHRSQYDVMAPLLMKLGWSATLFIYPSAISNAGYAMTWSQLRRLADDGFPVQSHTYWHPNLPRERRLQSADDFRRFVALQLERSKSVLRDRLGREVSMLAWPFGLSDPGLRALAKEEGWHAAFGLDNRSAAMDDDLYNQPRWLITDACSTGRLRALLTKAFAGDERDG